MLVPLNPSRTRFYISIVQSFLWNSREVLNGSSVEKERCCCRPSQPLLEHKLRIKLMQFRANGYTRRDSLKMGSQQNEVDQTKIRVIMRSVTICYSCYITLMLFSQSNLHTIQSKLQYLPHGPAPWWPNSLTRFHKKKRSALAEALSTPSQSVLDRWIVDRMLSPWKKQLTQVFLRSRLVPFSFR